MRAAMAAAEVGDDFYREDPTTRRLEEVAAERLGKEAALFAPSGTMCNLLAHMTHAPAGGEVVGPEPAHSSMSEGGGPARIAGITYRSLPQPDGRLDVSRYEQLTHDATMLAPATMLLWVEQPTRGFVVPLADLAALRQLADRRGVPVHFDGARIFHAAIALGVDVRQIAGYADSVTFCVSKGLGAPVGSLLVGSSAFIESARRNRQMLGGGMRQAGIIAAAGLYALDHHVDRLAEDHALAQRLAAGIARLPGLALDRAVVETNIFYVEVVREGLTAQAFVDRLGELGVVVNRPSAGRRTVRFVTHLGIEREDIDRALAIIAEALDQP
jgi:threonine aldolase